MAGHPMQFAFLLSGACSVNTMSQCPVPVSDQCSGFLASVHPCMLTLSLVQSVRCKTPEAPFLTVVLNHP